MDFCLLGCLINLSKYLLNFVDILIKDGPFPWSRPQRTDRGEVKMYRMIFMYVSAILLVGSSLGCASHQRGDRRNPASYSRAGRDYKEPRAMNHRRTDSDAMYSACTRERSVTYCRNRLGR